MKSYITFAQNQNKHLLQVQKYLPFLYIFLDRNIQSVNVSQTWTSDLMAINHSSLHVEVLVNIVYSKFTKITNLHSSFLGKDCYITRDRGTCLH
jgi:hypothetical protein